MLVAAPDGEVAEDRAVSKSRVAHDARGRSLPSLLEATVVPALDLLRVLAARRSRSRDGLGAGRGRTAPSSVVSSAVIASRRFCMLAVLGLTVRTIVGFTSGTFMYFLQPVVGTLVLAAVFLGSVFVGRPIIGRLASDFCPLSPEIANRPAVLRLFSGLTLLWAGVHFFSAATTLRDAREPADDDLRRAEDGREPRPSRSAPSCSRCRGRFAPRSSEELVFGSRRGVTGYSAVPAGTTGRIGGPPRSRSRRRASPRVRPRSRRRPRSPARRARGRARRSVRRRAPA